MPATLLWTKKSRTVALGDWQQQSIYLAICAGDLDKGSVLERRPISLLSGPPPVVYFLL